MIRILDCTLRDGGYINDWNFGSRNIRIIFECLINSGVDIIECGYLNKNFTNADGYTCVSDMEIFDKYIPEVSDKLFVCMIDYGKYDLKYLPPQGKHRISGIRLAFHKKDWRAALLESKYIMESGYQLFLQPMLTMNYTDIEFLELVEEVNKLNPNAFYIVDSFGSMRTKDLIRYLYLLDYNLNKHCTIGFHSHNNLQLSYSNAKELINQNLKHDLILDASVFGMGRGAGNLNTELIVDYINEVEDSNYQIKPLLLIMDKVITPFYNTKKWGYTLAYYLSGIANCHPNYANFLEEKKALTVENIENILKQIPIEKKAEYSLEYAKELFINFMKSDNVDPEKLSKLKEQMQNKTILLLAPGQSILQEEKIIKNKCFLADFIISVNFIPQNIDYTYIFVSNLKRFEEIDKEHRHEVIAAVKTTSSDIFLQVDYQNYVNDDEFVGNNAGMMAIKFFINLGVKRIMIAGMDGYDANGDNYVSESMKLQEDRNMLNQYNIGMSKVLKIFEDQVEIEFVTPTNLKL